MVGEVPTDDLDFVGLALQLEVLASQLPGRLDGLGSTGSKEHPIQVTWRQFSQKGRQFNGRRVPIGPDGEVPECRCLVPGRPSQFRATVPQLADKQTSQAVEVPVSLGVPDVTPLAALDDPGPVDVVLEDRKVSPQVLFASCTPTRRPEGRKDQPRALVRASVYSISNSPVSSMNSRRSIVAADG